MTFRSANTLEKHTWVGGGLDACIYHVAPTIVAKTVRRDRTPEEEAAAAAHPFLKEIAFYQRRNESQYPCQDIVECFLLLPDHLILSYCPYKAIAPRFFERQERETGTNGHFGLLIRVTEYEDPGLIARWIQQTTSALEYVEKLGFCHNDLHASNCLLDENFNMKLADFVAGPLPGTYGQICSARTEQFAVGTLLYFMVYGHEPYDDVELSADEWDRRFAELEFPDLYRDKAFDGLISACWHNVYSTMALLAYDVKRKTEDIALDTEYIHINSARETKTCQGLVRGGLLGPELALRFQPAWKRYLHAIVQKGVSIWQCILQKSFWIWS